MTTERDPRTRIVQSWLREDAHENAERVLLRALDEVDTTPQRRSFWAARRFVSMNNQIRFTVAAAAAAVVALAIAMTRLVPAPDAGNNSGPPSATATPAVSVTAAPSAADLPLQGAIVPGRYRLTVPASNVEVVLTLDDGWTAGGGEDGVSVAVPSWYVTSARGSISFWLAGNVGADACNPIVTAPDPPIGPSVGELLTAIVAQRNSDTTTPAAVVVGGHDGQRLTIKPAKNLPTDCDQLTWFLDPAGEVGRGTTRGDRVADTLYMLDVDGQRVVIVAYITGSPEVFDNIIASMQLSRG